MLQREYNAANALALINRSEGKTVQNGQQRAPMGDEKAAHSLEKHLLKGSPGARGAGVSANDFANRFIQAPTAVNSGWIGKGEMALLLCEALNSTIGQYALGQMDGGASRMMIHYFNEGKLRAMHGGAKIKQSNIQVTPAQEQIVFEKLFNRKTGEPIMQNGIQREIQKKLLTPASSKANVTAQNIATVNVLLLAHGGGLHLQTLYPSSEAVTSYAEWELGGVESKAYLRNGTITVQHQPRVPA